MLPASVGVLHYRCFAYRHLSPPETLCLNSTLSSEQNYWHCAHSMRSRVYETVGRLFVRPSVRPIIRPLHATAPGLLLWARRAGNIDRLLHGRRSAAAAPQQGAQQQMWAVPHAPSPPCQQNTDLLYSVSRDLQLQPLPHPQTGWNNVFSFSVFFCTSEIIFKSNEIS